MSLFIVIPAAGASSRMRGRDKLNETIHGHTILRRQTNRALGLSCPVLVCLPPYGGGRQLSLAGLAVEVLEIKDAAEGMGATLRAAATYAKAHHTDSAMMILLPDVPGVQRTDIEAVSRAFTSAGSDTVTRATDANATPGTPLILPPRVWRKFAQLTGDSGGREALEGEKVVLVPLKDDHATHDLDTPEDWEAWRAETGIAN